MKAKKIEIASATIIYFDDWRKEAADVDSRLRLLDSIAEEIRRSRIAIDLLMLPAGFLQVRSSAELDKLADRVRRRAPDLAVLFGIDVNEAKNHGAKRKGGKDPALGNFAYMATAGRRGPIWGAQQLAASSSHCVHWSRVPNDRVVRLGDNGGAAIGVLVCGEVMADVYGRGKIFRKLREMVHHADVVLDIAHADVRWHRSAPRTWRQALRNAGHHVIVAHHLGQQALCRKLKTLAPNGEPHLIATTQARSQAKRLIVSNADSAEVTAYVDVYRLQL